MIDFGSEKWEVIKFGSEKSSLMELRSKFLRSVEVALLGFRNTGSC